MRETVETGLRGAAPTTDTVAADLVVTGGPTGRVRVRIVRPRRAGGVLPVVLYAHGLGWVGGALTTHDDLIRRVASGVRAAVVFPDFDLAPEHSFPMQVEQVHAVAEWVARDGADHRLDGGRMAIAGDAAGGSIAAATTAVAADRGGAAFAGQLLFHPASPLRAPASTSRFPDTFIVVGAGDAVGEVGDTYAESLRRTGATVEISRSRGTGRDLVGVDPLRHPLVTEEDVIQGVVFLRGVLGVD